MAGDQTHNPSVSVMCVREERQQTGSLRGLLGGRQRRGKNCLRAKTLKIQVPRENPPRTVPKEEGRRRVGVESSVGEMSLAIRMDAPFSEMELVRESMKLDKHRTWKWGRRKLTWDSLEFLRR